MIHVLNLLYRSRSALTMVKPHYQSQKHLLNRSSNSRCFQNARGYSFYSKSSQTSKPKTNNGIEKSYGILTHDPDQQLEGNYYENQYIKKPKDFYTNYYINAEIQNKNNSQTKEQIDYFIFVIELEKKISTSKLTLINTELKVEPLINTEQTNYATDNENPLLNSENTNKKIQKNVNVKVHFLAKELVNLEPEKPTGYIFENKKPRHMIIEGLPDDFIPEINDITIYIMFNSRDFEPCWFKKQRISYEEIKRQLIITYINSHFDEKKISNLDFKSYFNGSTGLDFIQIYYDNDDGMITIIFK